MRHAAGWAAGLAIGLTLTFFGVAAAVQGTAKPTGTATVRVLDDRGRPITSADVWMQVTLDETDGTFGHGTTDGQGRFLMPVPAFWRQQPEGRRFGLVWAHAPGHHLVTANAYTALIGKAQSIDLTLGPAADTAFLVLDPEGQPVAGATVEPRMVKTPVISYYSPPRFILPTLRAVTGVDGRAQLPAVPREDLRSVRVATKTLGIQYVTFADLVESGRPDVKDVVTGPAQRVIRLRPTGRIFGRIIADRPEWTRGVNLNVITNDPDFSQHHVVNTVWDRDVGEAEAISRADGLFVIPAIAVGEARFEVTMDPALRVLPRIPVAKVRADTTTRVEIRLEQSVRVRGTIRALETGDPVAAATILIGHGAPKEGKKGVSDSQGRFEVNTLPGEVTMQVISTPGSFVQVGDDPSSRRHRVPLGVEAFDLPPIEVVRGVTVQGRLVDAADQPIANASVYADAASGNRRYGAGTTDRDGAFTMMIPSGVPLRYRFQFDQGGFAPGMDPGGELRIVRENPLLLRAPGRKSS